MLCPHALLISLFACLILFSGRSEGQPTTDPVEVQALSAIFKAWSLTGKWNASEPCNTSSQSDNPGISCNCGFVNGTVCHITELRAYGSSDSPFINNGIIPNELGRLLYLKSLQLQINYLSGPLPAFIGNLSALEHLNVRGNSLNGIIPKELGNLSNLSQLDLGMNNFSGSLPIELGNLNNLREIRLDSLGTVSGQIPSTFVKLQKLQVFWASDNNFMGKIPDFIGNLAGLIDLRFQGNSFQGPIPASFANLTNLAHLRIGELLNVSSDLAFAVNMTSLSTLILRNSKISGTLPVDISLTNLKFLDLSFNNLIGPIPKSLFNLSSLEYLFLGNNSLSGDLPQQKSPNLLNVDLSYNDLSGSFPSWVGDKSLRLNLVANKFIIAGSNSSILPAGLDCLQQDIPCNRSNPSHSSFAIDCGGNSIVNAQIPYEVDNFILGTASYHVIDNRWAVSSVGNFTDSASTTYIQTIPSGFQNTQYPQLFQTSRLSPSSLRYYGIGLENGNYTINLQFAETRDWRPAIARRRFDIYIQGDLTEKDFDITKQTGGLNTLIGVYKNYSAVVANNFLEIHFFWAGKGTCCLPLDGTYGVSVAAISVTSDSPERKNNAQNARKNRSVALIAGLTASLAVVCCIVVLGLFIWRRKKIQLGMEDDEELRELTVRPNSFSYTELKAATEDFRSSNKLGEGGFGSVFKGVLSDGREVAIKKLSVASVQGKRQFVTEIATISAVQHRNLVKLYGCCYEGNNRLLVYEYLANRSLDQILFGNSKLPLDWPARFGICLGTARGLAYLHEESDVRIVHRDVKASNILLDSDLSPKVSDFGLAKLRDDTKSHITTGVAGTIGYLAPEYAMRGQLTEKADVFGFGVVVLEILCGRKNTDPSLGTEKMYLLEWAWHLHEEKRDMEMLDPSLSSYTEKEVVRMIGVAFLCTQAAPMRRPPMSRVVAMLVGDMEVGEVLTRPSYLMDWRGVEAGVSMTSDTFSSSNIQSGAFGRAPSPTDSMIATSKEGR